MRMRAWEQLDLDSIADQYSTPLYITDRSQILKNLNAFIAVLGDAERVLFPVKACPCVSVFQLLAQQGCGADCASKRELELARIAGVDPQNLSYYSPATDIPLAMEVLRDGGSVVIDSHSKLIQLQAAAEGEDFPGKLFLRVNPILNGGYGREADYQKHTSHGSQTSQFGIPSEHVVQLLRETKLSFSGIHVHVGTQMDNVAVFQESLSLLHRLGEEIHESTRQIISEINLGGGLGIPSTSGEGFPTIKELGDALEPYFDPFFAYKMEPGNALFGDATCLLTRVVTRKQIRGQDWAIIDVGTNQLLKVTLAGFKQEVLRSDGSPLSDQGSGSIAGPLCFAGDVILPETDLTNVNEGDVLLLPNAGAYCRAVSNRFNGQSEPGTLMVNGSEVIGLAYDQEDTYWEPTVQSYRPQVDQPKDALCEYAIGESKLEQLRSDYIKNECTKDTYAMNDCRRVSRGCYELSVNVDTTVPFVSAPLMMRIVSDATIVAMIDHLGQDRKEVSVWGSRFNFTLNSILRSNRTHLLKIILMPQINSGHDKNQKFMAYWQFGKGSHGNILVVV